MKIISKLSTNNIKYNKVTSIAIILTIAIATTLLLTIMTFFMGYREYLVKNLRLEDNWEAKISNIEYEKVSKISDNRIKEISITENLGITETRYSKGGYLVNIGLNAYDDNAFKNEYIKLKEGRLPENEDEIVISNKFIDWQDEIKNTGDKILLENLGEEKEYVIVGIAEKTNFDKITAEEVKYGAITRLNTNTLKNEEEVNVKILAHNVKEIYDIINDISKDIKLKRTSEKEYNNDLLTYELALAEGSDFQNSIYLIIGVCITIVGVTMIIMIYTIFNIEISKRHKQIGMLVSIGMTRKQAKKMISREVLILLVCAIPVGIILSAIIVGIMKNFLNDIQIYASNLLNISYATQNLIKFEAELLYKPIIITIITIAVMTYLATFKIVSKIGKKSEVETIRENATIKIKSKNIKTCKIIKKLFGNEGEIAYKNIKRNKKQHVITTISLMISVILYITATGIIKNIMPVMEKVDYNFIVDLASKEEIRDEELKKLQDTNLIENMYIKYTSSTEDVFLNIEKDKVSNEFLKKMEEQSERFWNFNVNEDFIQARLQIVSLSDETLKKYCLNLGIKELQDNECILINNIKEPKDDIQFTNLKTGDIVKITNQKEYTQEKEQEIIGHWKDKGITWTKPEIELYKKNLTIRGVTNNEMYEIKNNSSEIIIVTNQSTLTKIMDDVEQTVSAKSYIQTDNVNLFEKELMKIFPKDKYGKCYINMDDNYREYKYQKALLNVIIYGSISFIFMISISNVILIILNNINSREKEFACMKSIGMTQKQLNKMLFLEGVLYGINALIWGEIIGFAILEVLSNKIYEFILYINWKNILIITFIIYISIFTTIGICNKKMKKKNIMDSLKKDI